MGDIVWLASYPKSGNTWLRVFLTNLLHKGDGPADINKLGMGNAADRRGFDEALGVESSDMSRDEVECSRPLFYRKLAAASSDRVYLKVHDAYIYTSSGEALIPRDVTSRVVYLVRNPLDIAVSFAHHLSKTVDATIDVMADANYAFASRRDRLLDQLEQRLLSWSGHIVSWLDQTSLPVYLMRYEDMLREPIASFEGCLRFLDLDPGTSEIKRALSFSSFSVLSGQEREAGFREKPPSASTFFRSGKAGGWQAILTEEQIRLVLNEHSGVMKRLGYVDDDLSPL
jgi:aryl sulfotransferase